MGKDKLGSKDIKSDESVESRVGTESQTKSKGMPQDGVSRWGERHEQLKRHLQVDNLFFEDLDAHQTIEFVPHGEQLSLNEHRHLPPLYDLQHSLMHDTLGCFLLGHYNLPNIDVHWMVHRSSSHVSRKHLQIGKCLVSIMNCNNIIWLDNLFNLSKFPFHNFVFYNSISTIQGCLHLGHQWTPICWSIPCFNSKHVLFIFSIFSFHF